MKRFALLFPSPKQPIFITISYRNDKPSDAERDEQPHYTSRSPRHLITLIPTPLIISEKRLIPFPAHLHELHRRSIRRRSLLFLNPILPPSLDAIPRRSIIMHPFALGVFIKDFDWNLLTAQLDDLADFDVIDGAEEGALALDFAFAEVKLVHGACQAVRAVGEPEWFLRDPGVLETFVDGDSFLHIYREHAIDEVEGRVADGIPVRGRIVEAASLDLLGETVRVVAGVEFVGKGRKAAEADI